MNLLVLNEREAGLEEMVINAILDKELALAIQEGDTGEFVSEEEIMRKIMD